MKKGTGREMASRFLVRQMLLSDLDTVKRIEDLSFPNPWSHEQFSAELGRDPYSRCHVAEYDEDEASGERPALMKGEVVGFVMAWLIADELHITNLAVAPEARRSGVAEAMLHSSLREAMDRGAAWCQLEVRESNTPARKLYQRFGFKDLGKRKGYYHDGEDAVVMGKELGSS